MAEHVPQHHSAAVHGSAGTPVHVDVHHEESDINVRAVLIGAAVFVIGSILMLLLLWGTYEVFRMLDRKFDPEAATAISSAADTEEFINGQAPADRPAFTEDWIAPVPILASFHEQEDEILDHYGETGSEGIVRVPIEDAKDLALRKGYPVRADAVTAMSELESLGLERRPWMGAASEPDMREGAEPQPPMNTDSSRLEGESNGGHE